MEEGLGWREEVKKMWKSDECFFYTRSFCLKSISIYGVSFPGPAILSSTYIYAVIYTGERERERQGREGESVWAAHERSESPYDENNENCVSPLRPEIVARQFELLRVYAYNY